jgi:hypothetical protein
MYVLKIIFLTSFLFVFAGCPRTFYVNLVDDGDPKHPVFCLSFIYGGCSGSGISMVGLIVYKQDDKGDFNKEVWSILDKDGFGPGKIKKITYGKVPEGYEEKEPAQQLKLNVYYEIADMAYFKLFEENKITKIKILQNNEYWDEVTSSHSKMNSGKQ